jgi:Uma2 family endonuclease
MQPGRRHWQYSLAEYVRLEEGSEIKHEFVDGSIYAMGGGSPEHAAMAMRIGAILLSQLRGRRCNVYSSDLRVRIAAANVNTYPDVTVVCGAARADDFDRLSIINPIVVVEVTSPSSEAYDRGAVLEYYKQIPSLGEIVLVSHREPLIEVWRRDETETGWTAFAAGPAQSATLASIDCALAVDEIYLDPTSAAPP